MKGASWRLWGWRADETDGLLPPSGQVDGQEGPEQEPTGWHLDLGPAPPEL